MEFVYDDQPQIVQTSFVHSWKYVPRYFREHVWSHKTNAGGSYYRLVFLLSLLINYTLFGLRPEWWHLATVAMHLMVTLLFYLVAVRLTPDRVTAAIATLIFGLHPVHLESVAWVSGVTDPIVSAFLLSSFLCYLKRSTGWLAGSLVLFGIALLTKETAIVLPALIFAHAWIFHSPGRLRHSLFSAAPYIALATLYWVVRFNALHGAAAEKNFIPLSVLLFTLPSELWFYLSHLLWPAGLSVLYNFPLVNQPGLWNFARPVLIVLGIACGLYAWSRRSRSVCFMSIWLLVTLAPVLNLRYFLPADLVHDRYLYLPSMGFCFLVAVVIRKARRDGRRSRRFARHRCIRLIYGSRNYTFSGTGRTSFPGTGSICHRLNIFRLAADLLAY